MRPAIAIIFASLLAACTTAPAPEPTQTAPAPEPVPVTEPEQSQPLEPAPEPEAEPLIVNLERMQDQTPADVIAYMGAPTLVRRDENVQVMIFETPHCVVEVVFYEPENGDHFRAEWLNARLRNGQDTDVEACTREWLEQTSAEQ